MSPPCVFEELGGIAAAGLRGWSARGGGNARLALVSPGRGWLCRLRMAHTAAVGQPGTPGAHSLPGGCPAGRAAVPGTGLTHWLLPAVVAPQPQGRCRCWCRCWRRCWCWHRCWCCCWCWQWCWAVRIRAEPWLSSFPTQPGAKRRRVTLLISRAQKCSAQGILMDL